jgi:hypothetical protein
MVLRVGCPAPMTQRPGKGSGGRVGTAAGAAEHPGGPVAQLRVQGKEIGMNGPKQRHGCLTAWLVLMIIANALAALGTLLGGDAIAKQLPDAPGWAFPVLGVLGVVNVVLAIMLFTWKKWAFFAFAGVALLAFIINLMVGVNLLQAVLGLAGPAILYGVLQIGGQKSGWSQLE